MTSPDFSQVERFCLFVGEPRSGHSVVGAIINAHPNALISHNLDVLALFLQGASRADIFHGIAEHERWLAARNREIGGYNYTIPSASQGQIDTIRVIGDKRAGAASRHLASEPTLLLRFQDHMALPLTVIHHVRNPWDNISSIWQRKTLDQERTLEETMAYYFQMLDGCLSGLEACREGISLVRTRHENLISDPEGTLRYLFDALSLPLESRFLESCGGFIHDAPRLTRRDVDWQPGLVDEIAERASRYDCLDGYRF